MSDIREIRGRMKSISDTAKITNAMYMISSGKMRRARSDLQKTRPHFDALRAEMKRIFRITTRLKSPYMYPETGEHNLPGAYAYLVITSDKGLAGYYNHGILKEVMQQLDEHPYKLYVVGEFGRRYFAARHIPFEEEFRYTAERPTMRRAYEIADVLMEQYDAGEISKIFVVYTDMENATSFVPVSVRLLPFHRGDFIVENDEKEVEKPFEFYPSPEKVLNNVVRSYVASFLYSALVDSFCSEQSARMNAMDEADKNAAELLTNLNREYNHARQGKITQEITEISAGAKALKKKKERNEADDEG